MCFTHVVVHGADLKFTAGNIRVDVELVVESVREESKINNYIATASHKLYTRRSYRTRIVKQQMGGRQGKQ